MLQELENNAAAAQKKYKGQYLKVSGKLGIIDSDGDSISIVADNFFFADIHCTIDKHDKAQESYVLNLSKGQWVTAYGKITDVGETLGYWMDVDKFE